MPLPTTLPAAILGTVLTRLAVLFLAGAGGDPEAARHAATQMLASYRPETADELRLAANIVSFSFQALEALAQAAAPGLPITRIMRLRGSAVSLSRESGKAERRLAQLQKTRPHGTAAETHPDPVAVQPEPKIEAAVAMIQEPAKVSQAAKASGQTWTQAYQERQREQRIAAGIKRAETRYGAQAIVLPPDHAPIAQVI